MLGEERSETNINDIGGNSWQNGGSPRETPGRLDTCEEQKLAFRSGSLVDRCC